MHASRLAVRIPLALVAMTLSAGPAASTTLIRQGVDRLTVESETVVQAKVLDIHSYWNAGHDFILTDVRLQRSRTLKGDAEGDLTLTLMGGSIGDVTTLVVGGPDLAPGSEYVLFLGRGDLPGAASRLTVRHLAQGVFEVDRGRAFSQAVDELLLPDAAGDTGAPGGTQGLALEDLIRQIRAHSNR